MTKDELKLFKIEMKIDDNISKSRKVVNDAYNYIEDDFTNIDKDDLLDQLENVEYILKDTLNLLEKLAELYELLNNKNS